MRDTPNPGESGSVSNSGEELVESRPDSLVISASERGPPFEPEDQNVNANVHQEDSEDSDDGDWADAEPPDWADWGNEAGQPVARVLDDLIAGWRR